MTRGHVDKEERFALARAVIKDGGNLKEFARRAGIKLPAASKYLGVYAIDLREGLAHAAGKARCHRALVRLLLLRVGMEVRGGQARVARALLPQATKPQSVMAVFKKNWAGDSVDQAIADLWPDDDPPKFRPIWARRKTPAEISAGV